MTNLEGASNILWSTGQQGLTSISNLAPGSYWVYVLPAQCGSLQFIPFTIQPSLNVTLASLIPPLNCNGGANAFTGSITLNVSGGSGDYSFDWTGAGNFKSTGNNIIINTIGTYIVTVTDEATNATCTLEVEVPAFGTPAVNQIVPVTYNVCGDETGLIELNLYQYTGLLTIQTVNCQPEYYGGSSGGLQIIHSNIEQGGYYTVFIAVEDQSENTCTVSAEYLVPTSGPPCPCDLILME